MKLPKEQRITISFTDSITGEFIGSHDSVLRKIDLIRGKHSKHVKLYKEMMTNPLRRAKVLIGDLRTHVRVYEPVNH